jgi:hypothetical protein
LTKCGELEKGMKFIKVFQSFSKINHLVHESFVNIDELEKAVATFRFAWRDSGMSQTTKVHIINSHLVDFVRRRGQKDMRLYSEQSHEAIHAEFSKTWSKYLVKEVSNPLYKKRLLQAVLDFNSAHAY